jgi:broad specificity phosphatase PhoE
MSSLLFIRHAATDMAETFCGHSDPPICSSGYSQISALITQLEPAVFDAIYCSDLRRAVATAELLAQKFHTTLTTSPRLREIHFGEWEGLRWTEIEQRDPAYALRWSESFPNLPAPGGEAFTAFKKRVLEEVEQLLRLPGDTRIAVVTHGGAMRVVLQTLLGHSEVQAWELTKSYCSTFTLARATASQAVIR